MIISYSQSFQQKQKKVRPLFTQTAEPLQVDILLLTTKPSGVAVAHLNNLVRMNDWADLVAT